MVPLTPWYLGFCINFIIAQAGELLTNSCQQKLLKLLMPLMVTTMKNHLLAAAQDVTIRNLGVNDAFIEIDYAMALSMCSLEDLQQVCTHTTPSP